MVKSRIHYYLIQAGAGVCFFFLSCIQVFATDNLWKFEPELETIYRQILSLNLDEAQRELSLLKGQNELHKLYLLNLSETVDILITEDEKRFEVINDEMRTRLEKLEDKPETPEVLFLRAEISLQRGFNLLNLSQELNAVLAIRQAYMLTQQCLKKYPSFVPIKKTSGVLQVMLGSVPDKYQWFMSLLGMKGSVKVGQRQLEELKASSSSLNLEATVLFYTIKGFLNQQFGEAARGFEEAIQRDPGSRLLMFLCINMLVKDSQSQAAYAMIQELDKYPKGLHMAYTDYLRAEVLLQRGDYALAISAYQKFIREYKSRSFKKDAYYKISLCYYLLGDLVNATKNYETARVTGRTSSEPDKYANAMLSEPGFPNAKILKIRFYTDGGYYAEALGMIRTVTPADLVKEKDAAEFTYRKGRLAHKTKEIAHAKNLYLQTIDQTGDRPWYFAPNAALQLGYIYQSQGDIVMARKYFEKALSYKRYEYKSGIDSKARFALDQLGK